MDFPELKYLEKKVYASLLALHHISTEDFIMDIKKAHPFIPINKYFPSF